MTPVTQLTDTDFAKPFKQYLEFYKGRMSEKLKEEAVAHASKFSMKFRPREVLYVMHPSIVAMKKFAEAGRLGIQGLRRNGQLLAAPKDGKIVEVTPENFEWATSFEDVGGHRYPRSWRASRMEHITDGIPSAPQWQQVLELHERQQITPEFQEGLAAADAGGTHQS